MTYDTVHYTCDPTEFTREASSGVGMPSAFQQDTTPEPYQQAFRTLRDSYPTLVETSELGRYSEALYALPTACVVDMAHITPEHTIEELKQMAVVSKPNSSGSSPEVLEGTNCPILPQSVYFGPELSAKASPWLDEYIRFSRKWAPRSYDGFHEAAGLWLLSVIAARRVALNFGRIRFPSLYIALCSRTSLYAKSTAAEIAQSMLRTLGLDWLLLPSSLTPQRFVHEMAGIVPENFNKLSTTEQDSIKTRLGLSGKRGWFYEEFGEKLSAMMKQNGIMSDFRGHLRRLDDGLPSFEYATMDRGNEQIVQPYLALLANLTPADLEPYAQLNGPLWQDGFFARFAFVSPPNNAKSSRDRFPAEPRMISQHLLKPLKDWHLRLGLPEVEIKPTKQGAPEWSLTKDFWPTECSLGRGVYDAFYWYNDRLLDMVEKSQRTYLDGNYSRFPEKALRVSMLLASLENDGVIELRHWARGQEIAERWRHDLHNLVASLNERGPSKGQQDEDKVYRQLRKLCEQQGQCTAREVGQRIAGIDTATAERYLEVLVRSGIAMREETGKTTRYSLPTGSEV